MTDRQNEKLIVKNTKICKKKRVTAAEKPLDVTRHYTMTEGQISAANVG